MALALGCDATTPSPPTAQAPEAQQGGAPPYTGSLEGTVYEGTTSSHPYQIDLGTVRLDGKLTVIISTVEGSDCVYDYLAIVDAAGVESRFEAEDPAHTRGDAGVDVHVVDNLWWRQPFPHFSGGQALVALKSERPQPLTTEVETPAGEYRLLVGSFTGDPANGPFAIRVHVANGHGPS
jgi:hypothetical protein